MIQKLYSCGKEIINVLTFADLHPSFYNYQLFFPRQKNKNKKMQKNPVHPLRGTVIFHNGDTSVDTSNSFRLVQDEADLSERRDVEEIFGQAGIDTQGPAGTRIPEEATVRGVVSFEQEDEDEELSFAEDLEEGGGGE